MAIIPEAGEVFRCEDGTISIVLPDTCDPNAEPKEDELREYAEFIGIDVERERHLLWIAREGLRTPLPPEWKPCRTNDGEAYYFNFHTGESSWDHPLDGVFREKVKLERRSRRAAGAVAVTRTGSTSFSGEGSSSSMSSSLTSVESEWSGATSGSSGGVRMPRRLEKGAGGNVRPTFQPGQKDTPLFSSSATPGRGAVGLQPLTKNSGAPEKHQQKNSDLGKLNELRVPGVTPPGAGKLLTPSSNSLASKPLGKGAGIGKGALGVKQQSKPPCGVRDMEANIRQRVEEEMEVQRRSLRLQHERKMAEERLTLDAELRQAAAAFERELAAQQKQLLVGKAETDQINQPLRHAHAETVKRVAELRGQLKREQVALDNARRQRIAEVKEEMRLAGEGKVKQIQEALSIDLEKAKKMQQEEYAKKLKQESERLALHTKANTNTLQKKLQATRVGLEKQLAAQASKPNKTSIVPKSDRLDRANEAYQAALREASANAAAALKALHCEYNDKIDRLLLEKKRIIEQNKLKEMLSGDETEANTESVTDATVKEEEERLKKVLEEKVAEYVMETQRLLSCKWEELIELRDVFMRKMAQEKAGAHSGLKSETERGRACSSQKTMTVEELRCFEAAYKDVYERHTRAMDRIRCEHERLLRDVKLPDVKSSAQYSSQLRELQKQWLETHPKPSLVMPSLEPLPGNAKLDEAALLPFDEDQQERVAAAVAAARTEASLDCERQLREEEESLASDVRSSVEAYRTKHLLEVRSKLVQRRKLLNDLEANISKGPGAQIAISEYGTDAVQTCSTQRDNIVSLEEVGKREEELRQRLQAQIDILQESKQRAQAQLRQKQLLQVQQQQVPPSFLTAGRLPPTVPIQTTASVRQEQLFTPRTSRQQKQPHEHNSLSTPLLNNTWSSIHSPHTGSSSARQTPLKVTAFLNPPLSSLEKQTAPPPEAGVVCPLRDERIEDQLRRVRAKLSEKRDELRAGQLRMERSRLMWLKDMESCRVRGDREAASMLLQVKKSLEEKARYLNREVLNLRQAFAHLRESELRYRREMMGARVASPGANNNSHADPHNITMSTSVAANGSKRLIELLEGMLVRAEQLERSVSRPKSKSREHRTTLMRGENKAGNLWAPSPRFRERRRDVGAGEKSSGRFFSDLTRWLEEQQPPG